MYEIGNGGCLMSLFDKGIRRCREAAGISQAALAHKIGVTQQAINFYEQGINTPTAQKLVLISNALGVTLDELLSQQSKAS
jgi:transcriptional regulator with XRE-family HTH domain